MLNLETVTLCGVDTRTPLLALQALQYCMRECRFGAVILFTHDQPGLNQRARELGVTLVDIGPVRSIEEYSRFMLSGMAALIPTEFALVTQWDGFVIHPEQWTDKFLEYDYIGALWADREGELAVGNGGFSLRSKRLLHALRDPQMVVSHPEDLSICDVNRQRLESVHRIRFAPAAVAQRFSYEHVRSDQPTFGFHGIFNLAEVLTPAELLAFTQQMTVAMAFGAGARSLARTLVYAGQYQAAREILRKRILGGDRRWRTLSLWCRMWLRQRLGIRKAPVSGAHVAR